MGSGGSGQTESDERTIPTKICSYVEKSTIPTRKILKSVGSPWEVRGK